MSLKQLPAAPEDRPRAGVSCQMSPRALASWDSSVRAATDDERTISIYDAIGYD